jgi:HSP20 family protein
MSALSPLPALWADPFDMFINPFSLLRRMQDEVSRALAPGSSTGNLAGRTGSNLQTRPDDFSTVMWVPAVEVAIQDNKFVVSAELPGLSDKDVNVQITDDAIVIQGERQLEREEDRGTIRRTERAYGQFYRMIALPDGADPEQARAEFDNGVLRITVPLSQAKSNTRQIPIEASGSTTGPQATGTQAGKKTETTGEKAA